MISLLQDFPDAGLAGAPTSATVANPKGHRNPRWHTGIARPGRHGGGRRDEMAGDLAGLTHAPFSTARTGAP